MTTAKTLGRVWAMTPAKPIRDPGESKYALGWVAEIPTYEVLNYLHNRIDANILALAERGVFEWGGDITYKKGALAWDETDGKIYIALIESPSKTLAPSNNPTQWTQSSIQISKADYDNLVAQVNNHITNYSNPHKLTAAQLGAYTKAQIDTLIANLQTELDAHEAASNPHGTDADDVGAVPITGGRYTGTVYHDANVIGIGADLTNAVKVDTGKIFFKKGTLELGIDATGKPYFYDGTKQYLVNEELFLTLKEANEKDYAVPLPDLLCNFQSDINVYAGTGPTTFTSSGGLTYVNKEGVTKTATVDEPRITKYGLALRDSTKETLKVTRTNDGYGFTSFTDSLEVYATIMNDGFYTSFQDNSAFTRNIFRLTGSKLEFIYTNNAENVFVTLTNNLSAGRHNFTVSFDGTTNTISAYLDGVKAYSAVITPPARTGWVSTTFGLTSGARSDDSYIQRFRSWATALTDKQVSTL